jgi:hypothetical protein
MAAEQSCKYNAVEGQVRNASQLRLVGVHDEESPMLSIMIQIRSFRAEGVVVSVDRLMKSYEDNVGWPT